MDMTLFFLIMYVMQLLCIYHNVAAMLLLHTGWVAELNLQVSFFNELSAEISAYTVITWLTRTGM